MMLTLLKKLADIKVKKFNTRSLIFLSDDWGSVRIRSKQDQEELIKKDFNITNRFDKYDALETNEDIEQLFEVLTKYKDHKGNHPVITAVTNTGNPDFIKIEDSDLKEYTHETIEATYKRYPNSDRVLSLIKMGIDDKIFVPQSHGREHVQINWWMEELQFEQNFARKVYNNEFFFFGSNYINNNRRNRDFSAAFDVWNKNDIETHKDIITTGLNDFEKLFGFRSKIFTPPAMFYSPQIESTLLQEGIQWLDVGRFFKTPEVGGAEKYQLNYLGRKKKSGLKVLVRNGVFEPNMSETDNGVARAMFDIEQAFRAKQPAILSNHRAAFVGRIDKTNREKGLQALDILFKQILKKWPDVEFISAPDLVKILK